MMPLPPKRCRIILALILFTRISIFAYSAAPNSSMLRNLIKRARFASELPDIQHLSTKATTSPAVRSNLFRGHDDTSASTLRISSSTALPMIGVGTSLDAVRGGASAGYNVLATVFTQFATFVGKTKARCFVLLVISVLIESYATTLSKQAKDTGNALLFVRACIVYLMCMVGFNVSLAQLDVSVAYALWSALGTTFITVVGVCVFGESLDMAKILFLAMIIFGVIGLNLRA